MVNLQADYDDGYFDKDEQGWCSHRVHVRTDGDRVTIRRSGDDNGLRPYDNTEVGTIGESWPELGLIKIVGERGTLAYFDTTTGRLRSPGEQMDHWFKPPPNYYEPGCLAVGLGIVAPVAAALGMRPGPPPTDLTMPPLIPSPTAGDSLESQRSIPGEHGCMWTFMLREYPPGNWLGPQFEVRVEGQGAWASLFVQERARAMFLLIGPLELYHRAIAVRDPLLAAWSATS